MESLFDDLFAYRIYLQDLYRSESIIIKRLKLKLIQLSYPENDINQILYNFYCHFNINITETEINDVIINDENRNSLIINENPELNNIISLLLNNFNIFFYF